MKFGPIMLDLMGYEVSPVERELLQHPLTGGVILFTRNFASKQQLQQLIKQIRSNKPHILIAVDQEGGRVQRFREEFTRLPPLANFGERYQQHPDQALQEAEQSATIMASELVKLDLDFSFAPILDIEQVKSEVIGDRSFSAQPDVVVALAKAYVAGMQRAGMAATGKHFPGHGGVSADSHHELPIDTRTLAELKNSDLKPYQALNKDLAAVMTAHIIYSKCDKLPASFSPFWLQEILRKQLQFNGAIFSDDLNMAGAHVMGDFVDRADAALDAGCDMLIACNNREGAINILDRLKYKFPAETQPRLKNMQRRSVQVTN